MLALRRSLAGSALGVAVFLLFAMPSARASHDPAHALSGEWKLTLPGGGGGVITFNAVSPEIGRAEVERNGSISRGEPCPAGAQYYAGTYFTLAGDLGTNAACGSGSSYRGWYHSHGAADFGAYQMTVATGRFQGSFFFPWTAPWAAPPPAQAWIGDFNSHVSGDGASAAQARQCRKLSALAQAAPECFFVVTYKFATKYGSMTATSHGKLSGDSLKKLAAAEIAADEDENLIRIRRGEKRLVLDVLGGRYKKEGKTQRLELNVVIFRSANLEDAGCRKGRRGTITVLQDLRPVVRGTWTSICNDFDIIFPGAVTIDVEVVMTEE